MTHSSRLPVFAFLLASTVFLVSQEFRIIEYFRAPDQQLHLRVPTDASSYYILRRGAVPTNINEAIAVLLGSEASMGFSDATLDPEGYYRVEKVPLTSTRDTDGDGLRDTYELQHPDYLDPLDATDVTEDDDADGFTNAAELQKGTDPQRRTVILTQSTTVDCLSSNYVEAEVFVEGEGVVVTIDCELSIYSLTVRDGGVVTHSPGHLAGLRLNVTQDLFVGVGSGLSVEAQGYAPGTGPGATSGTDGSGGAGHGGAGGAGQLGAGGASYGLVEQPSTLGSGGSVPGGGSIHVQVGGTLRVHGLINANGQSGSSSSGGGAGGSIWIRAAAFEGGGAVVANGSNAGQSSQLAGGGAGGRIAIAVADNRFLGTVGACGGAGLVPGGAGTVYWTLPGALQGDLVVDNCGRRGASTDFVGTHSFKNIRVRNGAVVGPKIGESLCLVASGDFIVETNGLIGADRKGYAVGAGPGGAAATAGGGGAGHGGRGGNGQAQPGGANYGDIFSPATLGSGAGGAGGGIICLRVAGKLQVDGQVSANGGADDASSGGGAGGSVLIDVQTLAGGGAIAAQGGAGGGFSPLGGGGAGGRVAIYWTTNVFTGTATACGGPGFVPGGAGTIYKNDRSSGRDQLVIDNCSRIGAATGLSGTNEFDQLLVRMGGIISPGTGETNFHLIIDQDAVVASTGIISANGLGHPAATGPGAAQSTEGGGGAGHGGVGGAGALGPGGIVYGSETQPIELGSGASVPGGGVLRVTVHGMLQVDGFISADGSSGATRAGGGSGGSILVTAGSLSGTGFISARGGNGGGVSILSGGGGGGRIAIYTPTTNSVVNVLVTGGAGATAGQPGTIHRAVNP